MTTLGTYLDGETINVDLGEDPNRGVLTVSLNRPLSANARNQTMRDELAALWHAVARDEQVRVVIMTGEGDKFFCAGMDLKEAAQAETPAERRDRIERSRDIELLAALPQVTIAAVNGFALGGGLEMALACDLRIVASSAQLGLPEITHGLIPGGGGTSRLPRLIGQARATELVLTGKRIEAQEALAIGLASRVMAPHLLRSAANEWAQELAGRAPRAMRYAKELLRRNLDVTTATAVEAELQSLLDLLEARNGSSAPL